MAQLVSGRVVERLTSVSDSAQTFALYLPPAYDTGWFWPALLVMVPRGRGMLGLERFQEAAGWLGWIVLSSYDTLSDGPLQPNVDAVNAMLASAQARLAVDPSRVHVNLAFYEPRAYLASGDPARALRMLEAAAAVGPIQGESCALLRQSLVAASLAQRARLAGQCAA